MPQKPIMVFVTPTPQVEANSSTTVPTLQPTALVLSATPIPATVTPTNLSVTETANQGTVGPTVTFVGSVIQPNYTLPPSDTPYPTSTPPASAIPTEGPTSTAVPTQPPAPTNAPVGPAPTALPNLDRGRVGIQLDPMLDQKDWNDAIRRVNELGVGWLKVQIAWKTMQPNRADEFGTDFARLQLYLQDAKKKGLRLVVSIAKAPDWARSGRGEDGPPDDPQLLANFLSFYLLKLGDTTDAIEIWNEPNLIREWQGQPLTGTSYMGYFGPAYNAIRAYSKTIIVVTAGLAPTGNQDGAANDRQYLQQMYAAGLGKYGDVVVGIHPYGWGNSPDAHCCDMSDVRGWDDDPHFFFSNNIEDYRKIMTANGHSNTQMWSTEFGWATWQGFAGDPPDKWMSYNDAAAQGNYTIRAIQIAQGLDYMGPMLLWNLNFANSTLIQNRDERAGYSIVLPPPMPERPLYWMLFDALHPDIDLKGKY